MDVGAYWRPTKKLSLSAGVANLFNQKYWDWGLRMGPATSQEDVFSAKKEAEREAVAFARRRFEQWRKAKGRLSIKKLIETLRPMLNQAAES